jgi:WD40 repeat protein
VTSVAFMPDGRVASTGDDQITAFTDVATGASSAQPPDPDMRDSIAFDPAARQAASPVNNQTVKVWSVATGATLFELVGHVGQINSAAWSSDGALLLTGAMDGTARIWSASMGDLLATLQHGEQVWSASFSPDGRRVVTSSDDGTAAIWDLPTYDGSADDLDRLIRCRVPFEIVADRLAPRRRDRAACTSSAR